MRKTFLTIIICLISAVLFAGCDKAPQASAVEITAKTEEKSDDREADDNGKKQDSKKTKKKKKTKKEDKSMSLPEFCISTQTEQKEIDGDLIVDHTYEQINIDDNKGSYSALAGRIDDLNSDIVSAQQESMRKTADYYTKLDPEAKADMLYYGYYPLKEDWRIYVRRADRQVFSAACEYREHENENDYVKMRGHSYLMDSGRELELSDIVDDEDAFYNLLANELSVVVTDKMRAYTDNYDMEPVDSRPNMDDSLKRGDYGWVLDPQGVTFWFDTLNAVLSNVTVTVLFADDKEGTIFKKDFVSNAPAEWIMQIPGNYSQTFFDNEEDGTTDMISWMLSETGDNEGNRYPSGIDVCINGRNFLSSEIIESYDGMFYGTIAMLVHRDKQTYFMTYYCEEAEPNFVTLSLKDDIVKPADVKYVYIGRDGDGEYVPTDPSAIRVYSDHGGDEITEYPPEIMSMDSNGMLSVREVGSKDPAKSGTDKDADEVSQESDDMVEITKDMQKKLNIFLSNFAEQRLSFYDYGEDDMYRIGYFAFRWSYINKNSDVKMESRGNETYYTVSYDIIKNLADRYFGRNVKKEDLEGFESRDQYQGFFENGNYYIPAADGEIFASIAVATSVEDTGNDIYRVEFAVFNVNMDAYWDNDEEIPKQFYDYTFNEASESKDLIQTDCGYAIVKKDEDSYKLRYYELYR